MSDTYAKAEPLLKEITAALDEIVSQQTAVANAVKDRLLKLVMVSPQERRALLAADLNAASSAGFLPKEPVAAMLKLVQSNEFSLEPPGLRRQLGEVAPQVFTTMSVRENLGNWPEAGVIVGAMAGGLALGLPGAAVGAAIGGAAGTIIGRLISQALQ